MDKPRIATALECFGLVAALVSGITILGFAVNGLASATFKQDWINSAYNQGIDLCIENPDRCKLEYKYRHPEVKK